MLLVAWKLLLSFQKASDNWIQNHRTYLSACEIAVNVPVNNIHVYS